MISIKKYLQIDAEIAGPLHAIALLLEAVGRDAVRADEAAYKDFRREMEGIAARIATSGQADSELMVQCGAATQALRAYNCRATAQFATRGVELKGIVEMLTASVATLSKTAATSVSQLNSIRGELVKVTEIDDIRLLRSRLGDCLKEIEHEVERQQESARTEVDLMAKRVAKAQAVLGAIHPKPDPVTGLPGRPEAEAAIAEVTGADDPHFVVVFVIERLDLLNCRYGYAVGDVVLRRVAAFLSGHLQATDRLFRWSGAVLLAKVSRPDRLSDVQREVSRMLLQKLEIDVQTEHGSLLLPVVCRASVFPIFGSPSVLLDKVETFVSLGGRTKLPAEGTA